MQKTLSNISNSPLAFIWFCIKPYRRWFFTAVLFVLLWNLSAGLQNLAFKGFVDSTNASMAGEGSTRAAFLWTMSIPMLILFAAAAARGSGFMINFWTVHVRTRAIKLLFEHLSLHSISYFNDNFSGALSNRVTTVAQNVSRVANYFLWNILSFFVGSVISIILIFSVSRNLAIAVIVGFILLIPINYFLTQRQRALSEAMAKMAAKLRGEVIDVITNISAVQQYVRRVYEMKRLDTTIAEYRKADVKSDNYGEWVMVINNALVVTFIVAIVGWSFLLWSKGEMSVGDLVMIVTISRGFIHSLSSIGENWNTTMEIYGEIQEGLREIIQPHGILDKDGSGRLEVAGGGVRYNNVAFAYEGDSRKIFGNLSLDVKGGEKVGIVGTSGAGKTTLIKLLLRQYDIAGGSIMIGEQDIRDVTQDSLRENISLVPQEPMLFHRSIRENIMYGKPSATEEEMIEVAKKAQAHEFIETLPNKYDSLVGERGVKLSVGQRQRIAIARAFLKNAPILVLDEATSALDSESEVAVQTALHTLMEGKTVFAIAHRLSTLREMDRIIVLKDGDIAEDGTHRALIRKKDGVYASLWEHQAGGFIKEAEV